MSPRKSSDARCVVHTTDADEAGRRGARVRERGRPGRALWCLTRAWELAVDGRGETSIEAALVGVELAETLRRQGAAREALEVAEGAADVLAAAPGRERQSAEAAAVLAMARLATDPNGDAALDALAAATIDLARVGRPSSIAEHADLALAVSLAGRSRHAEAVEVLRRRRYAETERQMPRPWMLEAIDHELMIAFGATRDADGARALARDAFARAAGGSQEQRDRSWAELVRALAAIDEWDGDGSANEELAEGLQAQIAAGAPRVPPRPRVVAIEKRVAGIRRSAAGGPRERHRAAARCLRALPEVLELLGPATAGALVGEVTDALWRVGSLRRAAVLQRRLTGLLETLPRTRDPRAAGRRALAVQSLAYSCAWSGLLDGAERLAVRAVEGWRAVPDAGSDRLSRALRLYARVLSLQGRHAEAAATVGEIFSLPTDDGWDASWRGTASALLLMAEELALAGLPDDALSLARDVLALCEESESASEGPDVWLRCRLAQELARAGSVEEGAAVRDGLPALSPTEPAREDETSEEASERAAREADDALEYRLALAECDLALGRPENAEQLARLALSEHEQQLLSDVHRASRARSLLGKALLARGTGTFEAVRLFEQVVGFERNARFAVHPRRREAERLQLEARSAAEALLPGWPTEEQPPLFRR